MQLWQKYKIFNLMTDIITNFSKPFTESPLDENLVFTDTKHGEMIVNKNGKYLEESLIKYGEFMEQERFVFHQLVRPNNHVLDIGANIGLHTRNLSELVGANGKVYAFEPQPYLQRILTENIKRNPFKNTILMPMGLGEVYGSMNAPIYDPAQNLNFGGISLGAKNGVAVPIHRLDDIRFTDKIHFVKMDVEGMELSVLEGGAKFIAQNRPIFYCENDRVSKYMAVLEKFWAMDYKIWWHLAFYITQYKPYRNEELLRHEEYFYLKAINMICFPKEIKNVKIELPEATPQNPITEELHEIFEQMRQRNIHIN